jgi:aspartate/methionine/tyrosine aminotransferase
MVSQRLQPFGSTIFTEISALSRQHGATDLGQGYPTFEGPESVKQAAIEGLRSGWNQYPPSMGIEELRTAVAERWKRDTGLSADPDREITVTSGATEALAATFIGSFDPGDEVILIEPYYDAYPVGCALSGALPRYLTLHAPGFRLEADALESAVSDRTKAILINTPHNPTGRVFDADELQAVADLCRRHDLIAITDEVYERMTYGVEHVRLATLDGMAERTITISSVGKSFSFTGWKTGWAIAAPELTAGIRSAHQFLTFTTPNAMQYGTAAALRIEDSYYAELASMYRSKRDRLVAGLRSIGLEVYEPQGTYFVLADHRPFGFADDVSFVHHLITEVGVAAIPPSAFYSESDEGSRLVRFAFCKDDQIIDEALEKLASFAPS